MVGRWWDWTCRLHRGQRPIKAAVKGELLCGEVRWRGDVAGRVSNLQIRTRVVLIRPFGHQRALLGAVLCTGMNGTTTGRLRSLRSEVDFGLFRWFAELDWTMQQSTVRSRDGLYGGRENILRS